MDYRVLSVTLHMSDLGDGKISHSGSTALPHVTFILPFQSEDVFKEAKQVELR